MAGTYYFTLPFPPAKLSPNARLHWRALDRVKKAYKSDCAWSLFHQPVPDLIPDERIPLTITINPPDRRRRDRDNTQSSLKYAMDQLAEHLGVDDYLFDPQLPLCRAGPGRLRHRGDRAVITVTTIQRMTAKLYGVPAPWMQTPDRHSDAVWPRQVAIYLSRRLTRHSFQRIGEFFGGRHSSTVIYSYRQVQERIFSKRETEAQIGLLIDALFAGIA